MNRYKDLENRRLVLIKKTMLFLVVIIYPLLASIYPMIPPFIGLAGYIIIVNFHKEKIYLFASLLYLVNLDLNLSLPLFLSIFTIILVSMFIYNPLKRLIRCRVCLLFSLIMIIDFLYYLLIFIYDLIFGSSTVLADILLVYYIAIDVFLGVLL